jgi:hypothetical protein
MNIPKMLFFCCFLLSLFLIQCKYEKAIVVNYFKNKSKFEQIKELVQNKHPLYFWIKTSKTIDIVIYSSKEMHYKTVIDANEIQINDSKLLDALYSIGWQELEFKHVFSLVAECNCYSFGNKKKYVIMKFRNSNIASAICYVLFFEPLTSQQMNANYDGEEPVVFIEKGVGWTYIKGP